MEETRYVIEYKEYRRNRWHAAFTTYNKREAQLALWDLADSDRQAELGGTREYRWRAEKG